MSEYIFDMSDVLYNMDTGEAVFKPKLVGDLVRCKDCKHKHLDGMLDGIVWKCPFGLPSGENFFCGYGAKDGEQECNGQEAMSI